MSLFSLLINNVRYTSSDILLWNGLYEDHYTKEVLRLCKQWLSEEETFIMQTSGSTGAPKRIEIKRSQIEASALASLIFFQLKQGDNVLCPLNIEVVGGKMMLFRSMIGGLQLQVIQPDRALTDMPDHSTYDFMPVTAIQLYEVLKYHPDKVRVLNKLKHLLIGGGAVQKELMELIHEKLSCTVWQSYGMTETVSHIAIRSLHPKEEDVYTVLPNILIDIDERACLKIKGTVTNNDWVQTNDRVELLDETHFMFIGRADFVINSGGIKIQVEELEKNIEDIFIEHNIQIPFFIGGINDIEYGEKVVLILNNGTFTPKETTDLLAILKERLPKYHAPKSIFFSTFSYTSSGKIDRKKTIGSIVFSD
ncbi:MAG: AMP-binding protein [Cytophagales bacterium]|nr:AMP-binding protein [Cytophaga sp.]